MYAVPPQPIDNLDHINQKLGKYAPLENSYQTIPIHSDSKDSFNMLLRGFDDVICPYYKEVRAYEMANNTVYKETFAKY